MSRASPGDARKAPVSPSAAAPGGNSNQAVVFAAPSAVARPAIEPNSRGGGGNAHATVKVSSRLVLVRFSAAFVHFWLFRRRGLAGGGTCSRDSELR